MKECKFCKSKKTKKLFLAQNIHGRHLLSDESFEICECLDCGITFTQVEVDDKYYDKYYLSDYYSDATYPALINRIL